MDLQFLYDFSVSVKEIFLRISIFTFGLLALAGGWSAWQWHNKGVSFNLEQISCALPSIWFTAALDEPFYAEAFQRRKENQAALLKGEAVFSGFHFEDRTAASGITFRHSSQSADRVDWKPFHYDHFGAVAVADVNGDGHDDLFFTSLVGRNELWLNNGGGSFSLSPDNNILALEFQGSTGVAFGDINNDGRPDLIVTTVRHGIHLFENLGGGKFQDISQNLGNLPLRHSSAATFLDFNNDGLLDILVSNVGRFTTDKLLPDGIFETLNDAFYGFMHLDRFENAFLLKNIGDGHFAEVSKESGLELHAWNGDVLVNDLQGDGFPDIFVLNMSGPSQFFLNDHGKRFLEDTSKHFPKVSFGAMGGRFFDYNNDGLVDLFVTDMHTDMAIRTISASDEIGEKSKSRPEPDVLPNLRPSDVKTFTQEKMAVLGNAFYKNLGNDRFTEVSDSVNLENYWPWGVSTGDVNADGYEDVFISAGMGFPFRYGISSLRLNSGGKRFVDAEFSTWIEPRGETSRIYFHLDCESRDRAHPRCVYCRDPAQKIYRSCSEKDADGRLLVRGATADRSSALVDLNDDGALDLVVSQFNGPPRILLNRLAQQRKIHWLKVKLTGTRSNRDGLGAQVQLTLSDGRTQFRWNDGKSGYLSQSSIPLYFGLGEVSRLKELVVRWPSGKLQKIDGARIKTNQSLEIVEQ